MTRIRSGGRQRPQPVTERTSKFIPLFLGGVAYALVVLAVSPAEAIVNGEFDDDNLLPEVGAIVVTEIPDAFPGDLAAPKAISSGTLIHPRVLLTAGHSVAYMLDQIATYEELTMDDFVVSFDPDVTGDVPFTSLEIESVDIHPGFSFQQNDQSHDVGVIVLKEEAPDDIPLVVPPDIGMLDDLVESGELTVEEGRGTPLLVAGYGATEESEGTDPPFTGFFVLASGKRHWGVSEFQKLRRNQLHLSKNSTLQEDQEEIGGSAPGDSGGPVFWVKPHNTLVQVAVVSWGDDAIVELAVNARLDLAVVQSWLAEKIAEVEGRK
jgi:hypothetical protein